MLCSKRWLVICVGFPVLVYGPFRRNLLLSLFLSLVKEKSDFFFLSVKNLSSCFGGNWF